MSRSLSLSLVKAGIIVLGFQTPAVSQWERVDDPRFRFVFTDVEFANDQLGFAVARRAVFKTNDGGLSWTVSDTTTFTDHDITGVQTDSTAIGVTSMVYGEPLLVGRSTDEGQSWSVRTTGRDASLEGACIRSDGSILALGESGWLVFSQDVGVSFESRLIFPTANVEDLECITDENLWAVGSLNGPSGLRAIILNSHDGGLTWSVSYQSQGPGQGVFVDVEFVSASVGYALKTRRSANVMISQLWKTEDSGQSWTVMRELPPMNAIEFFDGQTGLTVGDEGIVMSTFDGGNTWATDTLGAPFPLFDTAFLSDGTAVIAGFRAIYRFQDFVTTSKSDEMVAVPDITLTAFPNPASVRVNVTGLPVHRGQTGFHLRIVDVLGRVVEEVELEPGSTSVSVDVTRLRAGVYFYQETARGRQGSFVVSRQSLTQLHSVGV